VGQDLPRCDDSRTHHDRATRSESAPPGWEVDFGEWVEAH
jgi:hypothetical protein